MRYCTTGNNEHIYPAWNTLSWHHPPEGFIWPCVGSGLTPPPELFVTAVRGAWEFRTMRRWKKKIRKKPPQWCVYIHLAISLCQKWKIKQMKLFSFVFLHRACLGECESGAWCRNAGPENHFLNINNIFYTGLGEDASSSQITDRTTSPAASY